MAIEHGSLQQNYSAWLTLLNHLQDRMCAEWPASELKPHVTYDELVVVSRYGELGRVYRDRGRGCFSSSARQRLQQLDADVPGLEFTDSLFEFDGWESNEGVRSDIEYLFKNFWETALEEAKLNWDGMMAASSKLDGGR